MKEAAFLFPSIFSLPFFLFWLSYHLFQACQVNCRTADFSVIEISRETRRKKSCKNKATEGWGIQRDGSKKCGQMNVLPNTALASLREPCSHTTAVMNIPPCLAISFLVSPFCLCILRLAINFPSAPETACYLNCCSVRPNTLNTVKILMTQVLHFSLNITDVVLGQCDIS